MAETSFSYQLRESPRARNVRLRVTFQRGLEVIVPRGYDPGRVPKLLERKQAWIREALERAEAARKFFEPKPPWRPPLQITLPAVGGTWRVRVRETEAAWAAVREVEADKLELAGNVGDEKACRAALGRWLLRQTHAHLVPRLQAISERTGLSYHRAFVKRQRTRWASCSRHRTISLNAKLLFLPPDLVDYAITHELCHVREMNHSKRFWCELARQCPEYKRLDEELRDMWKAVPRWAG
ncbi:MAG: M48 family metallopeptidase [Deltaproteobacteria bacterium]|nr:M48 family metallopeptidase [Deltaproteobacteria bacterium]